VQPALEACLRSVAGPVERLLGDIQAHLIDGVRAADLAPERRRLNRAAEALLRALSTADMTVLLAPIQR